MLYCKVQNKDLNFKLWRMLTTVSYFLCRTRILKYEEQIYEYVTPSENQPAETTEKETLKYKTFSTFSAPSKSEETEEMYQGDYYPGMLFIFSFMEMERSFHSIKLRKHILSKCEV